MTRRVRFTPLLAAGIFCGASALAQAGQVPFEPRPAVSTTQLNALDVLAADLDTDGDLDLVSSTMSFGTVTAFENAAGDGSVWVPRTVGTLPFGALSLASADIDGDGDPDLISTSGAGGVVQWFENTAGNGTMWSGHIVGTELYTGSFVSAGDVDRDGDQDIVTADTANNRVLWFENALGTGSNWVKHTVSSAAALLPRSAALADLDGDGDPDVIAATGGAQGLWFENTAGNGSAWTARTVGLAQGEDEVVAADVDGDGDLDLLVPMAAASAVGWHENVAGNATVWVRHTIATAVLGPRSVTAFDVDRDGDLDALVPSQNDSTLAWHENLAGDGTLWTKRTIATDASFVNAATAADLDGDGDPDVASAWFNGGTIAWYRNQTLHGNACFVVRTVSTASSTRTVAMADVDRDGDPDVVAASSIQARLNWYENVGGAGTAWAVHTIATDEVRHLVTGDVDGDGDADVVAAPQAALLVYWYENAGGGRSWTRRTLALPPASGAEMVAVADFSGDGDLDLAVAGPSGQTRLWSFENAAGDGSSWTLDTVSATLGHRALNVADVNRDGNVDILAHGMPPTGPTLTWFENSPGNAWFPHFVGGTASAAYRVLAADLDGDADVDLVDPADQSPGQGITWRENLGSGNAWSTHSLQASGYDAEAGDFDRDGDQDLVTSRDVIFGLELFENTNGDASVWTRSVLTTLFHNAPSLARGDVDRDGDADLLAILGLRPRWLENRGGQLDVAVTSILQAGPGNGDVVPMLRAVVTHLGRAGEPPLELASLGLRFATAEGTAYTTAQANAFVESVRVHRDSNGNGVFDPGLDPLVANVLDLSLGPAGVQTIAFADGDPAVVVEHGTPRAFFVVLELTAAASGQVPGTLRLVLVQEGPSALVAEDVVHDIPLRLACPRDAGTTIRYVVPVELTGFSVE